MALKIRLKRMGNRNRPFYRLVVQDSTWKRDGKTIADVGWYDAIKQPAELSFKEKEIYKWLSEGVQLTETARSLLKRYGILEKFKSGEYKQILEQADAPENLVVKMDGKLPKEKSTPAQASAPVPEPKAAAVEAEAPGEEAAKETAAATEA